jgi:hypothetical protein
MKPNLHKATIKISYVTLSYKPLHSFY